MRHLWLGVAAALAAACGSDQGVAPDAPMIDAPAYPAFAPALPQIVQGSGAVMASVKIVPVFTPGDPLRPQLLDFVTKLAASSTWSQMVGEYAVGALTVATPIDLAQTPPTSITDAEIESFVQEQLTGTSPAWGTVDATTLYVLFYPASTAIHSGPGTSCMQFGGYHTFAPGPGADPIVYVVIPRCGNIGLPTLDATTLVLSHEIAEAATDPKLASWGHVGDHDLPWALAGGAEVGDLCELEDLSPYSPPDVGYVVEREWSNTAAAAGTDPCVPVPADGIPYFGTVVDTPDTVGTGPGGGAIPGISVPVGTERIVGVHLFSTDAIAAPIDVQVFSRSSAVDLALDRAHGSNGDSVQLAIRGNYKTAGPTPITLLSHAGMRTTYTSVAIEVTP